MQSYIKKPTEFTPEIDFNVEEKRLSIVGVCAPENPILFFENLNASIVAYAAQHQKLVINLRFDYFNTGTSKCLLTMFKDLKARSENGFNAEINWYLDKGDDEMKENGEIFEELSGLTFNYLEYEE